MVDEITFITFLPFEFSELFYNETIPTLRAKIQPPIAASKFT